MSAAASGVVGVAADFQPGAGRGCLDRFGRLHQRAQAVAGDLGRASVEVDIHQVQRLGQIIGTEAGLQIRERGHRLVPQPIDFITCCFAPGIPSRLSRLCYGQISIFERPYPYGRVKGFVPSLGNCDTSIIAIGALAAPVAVLSL
jgi:hypothetical protein